MGKREKQERSRILKLQVAAFRKKFGRDPLPNEPVFFDPDADVPTPMNEEKMIGAFNTAGLPPEFAYAYKKTGLILMEGVLLIFERQALVFQPLAHDQGAERGDSAESCESLYDLLVLNRTGQTKIEPATRNNTVSVGKTLASRGMPPASAGTAIVSLS